MRSAARVSPAILLKSARVGLMLLAVRIRPLEGAHSIKRDAGSSRGFVDWVRRQLVQPVRPEPLIHVKPSGHLLERRGIEPDQTLPSPPRKLRFRTRSARRASSDLRGSSAAEAPRHSRSL